MDGRADFRNTYRDCGALNPHYQARNRCFFVRRRASDYLVVETLMSENGPPTPVYSSSLLAGPLCWLTGLALIVVQAVLFFTQGILSSWLIGAGIALLMCGNISIYWAITDRTFKRPPPRDMDDISAEEYDRMLDELEPPGDDLTPDDDAPS